MEPSAHATGDPAAQPGTVGAPPAPPHGTGATAAMVLASVVGAAVFVGMAVLAVLNLVRGPVAEDAQRFSSSDATFTLTLPDGWRDETASYRADFLARNGTASTIEGFATAGELPWSDTGSFVSMSGHPVGPTQQSAEEIGLENLDNWRGDFDEYAELRVGTFATDAGDVVWRGGLEGVTDDDDWRIVIATVVGDESFALFVLELRPRYYDAGDDFVESLKSLEFAPGGTAEDVAQGFGPETSLDTPGPSQVAAERSPPGPLPVA